MYHGLRDSQNARVLYLDMNSFFASVEQQRNPNLRNKPLAVVSHIGPAGTILAASYEAKAFGLKTGMRMKEALPLCPQVLQVEVSSRPYREVHRKFMAILQELCGPEVRACSVDEAVIPLSRNWYGSEKAHQLAHAIKARFREELGECIKCSIGIAPNTFLGKLGTDLKKPDGLVEITLENTPEILSKITLTDLCGIAERNAIRLGKHGITTPLEFYSADPEFLRRTFGIWGQYWWWKLHGLEPDVGTGPLKSMSHEHALKKWAHSRAEIEPVMDRLADRLIHRLRHNNFQCRRVGVFFRCKGFGGRWFDADLTAGNQTYETLLSTIHRLVKELPEVPPGPIKKVGIYFGKLSPTGNGFQLGLFDDGKSERVSSAIEFVRARYGFNAIQRGTVVALPENIAKEKLGFGRVKDL
ncbi:MAG TPA: DNA polymerase IV [Verrucomicrobiae bacterium]|nr:DNA polymerase IV [Verrucomicrobiae bacterium]